MTRTHRRNGAGIARAALALAVLATEGGCAPKYINKGAPNADKPYTFTIEFDGDGCPISAKSRERNCRILFPPDDCAKVKGGQSVAFEAKPDPGGVVNVFGVVFEPVVGKRAFTSDKSGKLLLTTQPTKKPGKTYTFIIVTKPGCEPLDPQIILD
jgi:hypothetical protein